MFGSIASQKLSATTYPFVAFIALQPRPGPRSSSSNPSQQSSLTVLSRHQGPPVPSTPGSALGPTAARSLCDHLTNQLLPRVTPFLGRIRSSQREREHERSLRNEQDNAFALSAQRDRERIEAKLAAERTARQEVERAEQQHQNEVAKSKRAKEEQEAKKLRQLDWCRYARRSLLPTEPAPSQNAIRVGIRLPDGNRLVRRFAPTDTLTTLYTFVAIQAIPSELTPSGDPSTPPEGYLPGEAGIQADNWSFKLVSAYPRSEIHWKASIALESIKELKDGGQLVVETNRAEQAHNLDAQTASTDDDDYNTEEE